VAAGALEFEQALFLVKKRSLFMQKACEVNPGTMAAIMGLSPAEISSVCQLASMLGMVQPANFNSSIQVAISGEKKGVEKAIELAKEKKAKRAVLLQVGGAFHSELMRPAQKKLTEVLSQTTIQSALIPVVANVTAQPVTEAVKIKELLIEQITKPVLWYQSTSYIYQQGITTFVEVGPGKVLQGLLKRSFKDIEIYGVDTISDLANWVNAFKERLALRE
jgi:[acyl-carrier-protein] S-malonyltransferase